jgi:Domain of unknown function (DUF4926)
MPISKMIINYPAASGRGMQIVLLPNRRFGLQSDSFAASSGECTPTRFKANDIIALTSNIQTVHKQSQQSILLQPRQVGTVVMNFNNEACLIDFSDAQGITYAMETIPQNQLMLLHYEPASVAA